MREVASDEWRAKRKTDPLSLFFVSVDSEGVSISRKSFIMNSCEGVSQVLILNELQSDL